MASSTDQEGQSRSASPGSVGDNTAEGMDHDSKTENRETGDREPKKPKDSKVPSRPRRKKARRACHACQRAHLTCGDERPCQRCIKRGLADQCCDGVRKKAKYLHDTPNDAFVPNDMNRYGYMDSLRQSGQGLPEVPFSLSPGSEVFPQVPAQGGAFPVYGPNASPTQLAESVIGPQPFVPQTPTGPPAFSSPSTQPNMQSLLDAAQQSIPVDQTSQMTDAFGNPFFDANDLSKYSFDPSSFNFGNHYGALEFGMLGQMATGAADTPPSDTATQMGQNFASPVAVPGFAESPLANSFSLRGKDQAMADWQTTANPEMARMDATTQFGGPTDSRTKSSRQTPMLAGIPINVSQTIDAAGRLTGTLTPPATDLLPQPQGSNAAGPDFFGNGGRLNQQSSSILATARLFAPQQPNRNPAAVYDSVESEYSYVISWHNLTALIKKRFSVPDMFRIAKSLASFRPSFIGATKSLGKDDLIFMEKCFQRTLLMYEDFIADYCLPTIVCRRTGEVAAVSDEFVALTGWSRDVLLGKEANFNANTGSSNRASHNSGTASAPQLGTGGSSRGGMNTPRVAEAVLETSRPQAVFLAELMDDASVIEFYEDFARLAFGDPRGRVEARVKLLKYRTKSEMTGLDHSPQMKREIGADFLDQFSNDNKMVDCACIWTIKRDVFDLPMMIVMNFLPCLS